jgi:hypothetical protein
MCAVENAQKIATFLTDHSGQYYCDKSLSQVVGVRSPTQVNQITGPLAMRDDYRRGKETCAHCGKRRMCIAFVGESSAAA